MRFDLKSLGFSEILCRVALLFGLILVNGCGNTFRPIAAPIPQPGGDPGTLKNAILLSADVGLPGSTTHIDVSGDTVSAIHSVGVNPVHAVLTGARVFVANHDDSTISAYFLPPLAGSGASVTTVTLQPGSCPVYINSVESINAYIAEPGCSPTGAGFVGVLAQASLTEATRVQVDVNPVAISELPSKQKFYVANKGSNSVWSINTADLSIAAKITAGIGSQPAAMDVSSDGACVYVANQGDGTMSVISTGNDAVATASTSLGAGASAAPQQLRFDSLLQRIYVVDSGADAVSVFAHSNTCVPKLLGVVALPAGARPTSVAQLANGSRLYVANSGNSTVSVVDAASLKIIGTINLASPVGLPAGVRTASGPISIASSPDSTRVYTANSTSANISVIRTSDNAVLKNIDTPACGVPGACTAGLQTPTFVVMTP